MIWSDIQTKGFVVIPGFLSAKECSDIVIEWRLNHVNSVAPKSPRVSMECRDRLAPKIVEICEQVKRHTNTHVDMVRSGQFYSVERGVNFGWHLDHDSYYIAQDAVNCLNFWIPIVKPDRVKSGICVVPFDSLAEKFPRLHRWSAGRGSIECRPTGDHTDFFDLTRLRQIRLPGPNVLEEVAVAPSLSPGDLIILRGDLFHRTQDTDTKRVSVSFRVVYSHSILSRKKLVNMGFAKFYTMAGKRTEYAKRLATFEIAGADSITLRESEVIYADLTARINTRLHELRTPELSNREFRELVWDCAEAYQFR